MYKNKQQKLIVLDMDGTIADLYSVPDWHKCLYETMDESVYLNANPIHNMNLLNGVLSALRAQGWTIVIDTWLSRTDDPDFHARIEQAKLAWLHKYALPVDHIIMTKYGVDKWQTIQEYYPGVTAVLVDDSEEIRASWKGYAIDGSTNIITQLGTLLLSPVYETER